MRSQDALFAHLAFLREIKEPSVRASSQRMVAFLFKLQCWKKEPARNGGISPMRHFALRLHVTKGRKEERRPGGKQEAEWLCIRVTVYRRSRGVEQKEGLGTIRTVWFHPAACIGASFPAEEKNLPRTLSLERRTIRARSPSSYVNS